MANDMIQCPLCDGLSRISRAQLIRLLNDPGLRTKIERLLAESGAEQDAQLEAVPAGAVAADFQTQVHSWNPANPMWKRSPKE